MEASRDLFLVALRAGLWGETLGLDLEERDAKALWVDARKQSCRGVVGQVLLDSGSLPPKAENTIRNTIVSIVGSNLALERVLALSVKALRDNGIEPVLMKGQGVASCYPQPLVRECGDIDLYVGKDNYRRSFEILSALSGTLNEDDFSLKTKHSHITIDGASVEVHQFSDTLPPRYNDDYQGISDRCLSDGFVTLEFAGVPVRTPEPTFHAFFLFNHLWRHFFTEGVGFRQVCDWTMYLHAQRDRIDRDRLLAMLKTLDLMTPWKVFGNITVDVLGLPPEEMPFHDPKKARGIGKVVRMMLKEGNFGHERADWYALDRTSLWGLIKVFFSITRRYLGLFPVFGPVVLREYSARIRKRLSRKV